MSKNNYTYEISIICFSIVCILVIAFSMGMDDAKFDSFEKECLEKSGYVVENKKQLICAIGNTILVNEK